MVVPYHARENTTGYKVALMIRTEEKEDDMEDGVCEIDVHEGF